MHSPATHLRERRRVSAQQPAGAVAVPAACGTLPFPQSQPRRSAHSSRVSVGRLQRALVRLRGRPDLQVAVGVLQPMCRGCSLFDRPLRLPCDQPVGLRRPERAQRLLQPGSRLQLTTRLRNPHLGLQTAHGGAHPAAERHLQQLAEIPRQQNHLLVRRLHGSDHALRRRHQMPVPERLLQPVP